MLNRREMCQLRAGATFREIIGLSAKQAWHKLALNGLGIEEARSITKAYVYAFPIVQNYNLVQLET